MMKVGEVWGHDAYYLDGDVFRKKYLLVLAVHAHGDYVYRLLTSRQNNRPVDPACFHGLPYPAFYLGVLGNGLDKQSWMDLRECEDMDSYEFTKLFREGVLQRVGALKIPQLIDALACAANAEDTTVRQRNAMLSSKGLLEA